MVIGIGGVSRAGKTTFAHILAKSFDDVHIFHQDDFAYPENQIPKIKDRTDWEHPKSINFKKLLAHIHTCSAKVIIVEGLLAFYDFDLNQLYDKRYFLKIEKSLFLKRKLEDNRWGAEPNWYIEHIWKSYNQYGLPSHVDNLEIINISENKRPAFAGL